MSNCFRLRVISFSSLTSLLLSLALSLPVQAEVAPVAPFRQVFNLSSTGIPFSIKAERSLEQRKDGIWQMRVSADNWLGEVSEDTRFNWSECIPQSRYYGYNRKGMGSKRKAELFLNQQTGEARAIRASRERNFPITHETTDKLSQTLALQCMLSRGDMALEMDVADEKGLDRVSYRQLGEEWLDTPAGKFRTVKLERIRSEDAERQTLLWFATDHDYALVQMIQREDGKQHTMVLRNITE